MADHARAFANGFIEAIASGNIIIIYQMNAPCIILNNTVLIVIIIIIIIYQMNAPCIILNNTVLIVWLYNYMRVLPRVMV